MPLLVARETGDLGIEISSPIIPGHARRLEVLYLSLFSVAGCFSVALPLAEGAFGVVLLWVVADDQSIL